MKESYQLPSTLNLSCNRWWGLHMYYAWKFKKVWEMFCQFFGLDGWLTFRYEKANLISAFKALDSWQINTTTSQRLGTTFLKIVHLNIKYWIKDFIDGTASVCKMAIWDPTAGCLMFLNLILFKDSPYLVWFKHSANVDGNTSSCSLRIRFPLT